MPTNADVKSPEAEVACYRAGTADLLTTSVLTTRGLERWLAVDGELREANCQPDLEADPIAPLRKQCTLLLRKARLHSHGVLRANETNNQHSVAVQMRPVLECAGQVVFLFDNLIIAPRLATDRKRAASAIGGRINADYYDTIIRATKGKVGHDELLATISDVEESAAQSVGELTPEKSQVGRLNHTDKVATLRGGKAWYVHLSKRFCHGSGDLRGPTWRGGVGSMNTWRDELAFAGFMDYLVEQLNTMNAYAALCPTAEGDRQRWFEPTLARLKEGREITTGLRRAAVSAFVDVGAPVED